jgi:branched-chain amino acid transport system permease protein
MEIFLDRLFDGISNGAIYAVLALALVMVYRATGTINFAQGEMALFCTYLAWWLTEKHVPVIVALLAATAVGFALGAASERVLVRPIEKRGTLATLIVLLGLFSVLNAADGLIWGRGNVSMPSIFPNTLQSYWSVFGARLYWANIGVWLLAAAVVALMFGLFNGTRLGLQMRATANNRESAALAGIRVGRILMLGWGISAAIGAVAGVLFTPLTPDSLSLAEMFPLLIYASAAALFGGLDSPVGAVVAGLLLGIVEVMLPAYVPAIGGQLQEAIAFVAIVAVLLLRPQGLFGSKEVERVL